MINPSPNAAPISPKFFALCFGSVMSAIDAWATDIFPPVIPSTARAINNNGMFFIYMAIANPIYDRQVPKIEIPRIFLRPYLSDSCPSIGAARNCINGKVAFKNPSKIYPFCTALSPSPDIEAVAVPNR